MTTKEALVQWRTLKDEIDEITTNEIKPLESALRACESILFKGLSIDENADKSETLGVDGVGYCYKKKAVSAQINDYDTFKTWAVERGMGYLLQNRVGLAVMTDLYDQFLTGEVEIPEGLVDFNVFEKLTIRRK